MTQHSTMWSSSAANEHLLHLHIPYSPAREIPVKLCSSFVLGHACDYFHCLHLAVLANALDDDVFYSYCYISIAKSLHHVLLVYCCENAQSLAIAELTDFSAFFFPDWQVSLRFGLSFFLLFEVILDLSIRQMGKNGHLSLFEVSDQSQNE